MNIITLGYYFDLSKTFSTAKLEKEMLENLKMLTINKDRIKKPGVKNLGVNRLLGQNMLTNSICIFISIPNFMREV